MLTLLLIGVIAVVAVGAFAVAVRADETVDPLLVAGPTTTFDPAAETQSNSQKTAPPAQTEWHLVTVTALCEAEDLLDALEAQGFAQRELVVVGNSSFVVRWR